MARVHPLQESFAGGVLSPLLDAQATFAKRKIGCRTLRNFLPVPQGPAGRRRGTKFCGRYKNEGATIRLVPFVVSETEAYAIEHGPLVFRIWRADGSRVTASSELIVNGTFDTEISGWTDRSSGAAAQIEWASEFQALMLTVFTEGSTAHGEQSVVVTTGQPHTLRFRIIPLGTPDLRAAMQVSIGTTAGGGEILPPTTFAVGSHAVPVTPAVSPIFIGIRHSTAFTVGMVDDVSLTLDGGAPAEVVTPYAEADLRELQWAQSADVQYVTQPRHALRKIRRFADTDWDLATVAFDVPPTAEVGRTFPLIPLTPAATTGLGVTFTAGSSIFLASDVGRQIVAKPGRATIRTQAGTSVTADITEAFRSTAAMTDSWFLDLSPQTTLTPNVVGPVGAAVTLTLTADGWTLGDVGKWVYVNGGVVEVTQWTSALIVTGRVRAVLASTTAAAAGAWSLEEPVATTARGFFRAVTFHEGRLHLGHGFTDYGSMSDDFENHTRGPNADHALVHPLTAGQLNTIQVLVSGPRDLLAGTTGPGFRLTGQGGPLTPENPPDVKRAWKESVGAAMPVVVDPVVILPEAGGRKLLGIHFSFDRDAYESPDLALLAEHLLAHGLVEVVFLARPVPTLWARDTTGGLFACTYLPEQQVLAWSEQPIGGGGAVEALCAVPSGSGQTDVLFLGVRRTVNGATVRTIERLDPTADVYVDSHVQVTGTGLTSVAGLGHLEGLVVQVRGDGATLSEQTVVSGVAPVIQASDTVQVGLYYDTELVPMPHEGGSPSGSALTQLKRYGELVLFVKDTLGGEVNGTRLLVRAPEDPMGLAPPLETGQVPVKNPQGWTRESLITIRQPDPQPFTLVGLGGHMLIEGG